MSDELLRAIDDARRNGDDVTISADVNILTREEAWREAVERAVEQALRAHRALPAGYRVGGSFRVREGRCEEIDGAQKCSEFHMFSIYDGGGSMVVRLAGAYVEFFRKGGLRQVYLVKVVVPLHVAEMLVRRASG